jgi:RNA polymerase sigma-54 factor
VIPDVHVRETPGGLWHVELNTDTLPKVLVDQRYHARVSGRSDRPGKDLRLRLLGQANWLVKSLDQRAKTILKVSSEIVRQQDGFLAFGVEHLRPLNLKTVADAIGMHESTVSRVTSNKYVATPRGVFELKFFFTSAIQATGGGEAHSAASVRHKIKALIEAESHRGRRPFRRPPRRDSQGSRRRHRPPHGGQVSRGPANPVVGRAPPLDQGNHLTNGPDARGPR